MSVINTGTISKDLLPGVQAYFGEEYGKIPAQYLELFERIDSNKAFEEDVAWSSTKLLQQKTEGGNIASDSVRQNYVARYTNVAYAAVMEITREARDDGQELRVAERLAKALARSAAHTYNVVGSNIYDRAFNAGYTGGDGVALCDASHPSAAGNRRNRLTVDQDLNETAYEQLHIDIRNTNDDVGLPALLRPEKLIISADNMFDAKRLTDSDKRPSTMDNDINASKALNLIPGGVVVNDYFVDPDAWFIKTSASDGLKFVDRTPPEMATDGDFNNMNSLFRLYVRFAMGWSDPMGLFGSPGA